MKWRITPSADPPYGPHEGTRTRRRGGGLRARTRVKPMPDMRGRVHDGSCAAGFAGALFVARAAPVAAKNDRRGNAPEDTLWRPRGSTATFIRPSVAHAPRCCLLSTNHGKARWVAA